LAIHPIMTKLNHGCVSMTPNVGRSPDSPSVYPKTGPSAVMPVHRHDKNV
jgi:hypothetical protein